jgi:hypothetical protein
MRSLWRFGCFRSVLTVLATVGWCSPPLTAQDATGRVIGVVTDPSGSVVPRAKVTLTNVETGVSRDTVTDGGGAYQIPLVPIGAYTVSVQAGGFRKSIAGPQELEINQSLKVDVSLEVGPTSETVQVEGNASRVETVNATLGHSVTSAQIVNAPLNGRNVLGLALLEPGVIPSNVGGAGIDATGAGFSVAGGRQDSVTFLLDGGVNNDLLNNGVVYNPNPETVAEFRILVNNYTAEFGRSGAGIVSVVTKSGTNQLHGSLYDYARNDALNANSFFNNQAGIPRDILKRHQFGASLGGPVQIPKVIHGKDRFFFFVAYQGQRQTRVQATPNMAVFTPDELNGDFSRSNAARTGPDPSVVGFLQKYPYFQPNAGLAARGIIDPTRINSISKEYIAAGWIPATPNGSGIFTGVATNDADELTWKPDILFTTKDRLAVTMGWSRNPVLNPYTPTTTVQANPWALGFADTTTTRRWFGSANYTKTLSASMINDFRFTAQRNNVLQAVPAIQLPTASDLGIKITPDNPTGPPILGFLGGLFTAGFSPQGPTAVIDNTYTWQDTFTWIKGRHSIKTGLVYTPYQDNTVFDFYINGEFFFYGATGSSFSGNAKADFLMGLPDEFLQYPQAPTNIRTHNIGWFMQDEWKLHKNLTLTLGIRYEYSSPKLDLQGRSFSLKFGQQSTVFTGAPKGLVFPGDTGVPVGSNFPDKNDWAPRAGIAWDPLGDGRMSIRGGFGVFYDILKGEDNFQFNGQAPFFGYADLPFGSLSSNPTNEPSLFADPYGAAGQPNPFPSKPPPKDLDFAKAGFLPVGGASVYYVDPHLRTPYIYQYNFSIQREVVRNMMAEVAYVGSNSHKLTALVDSNPFLLGTRTRLYNAQPGVAAGTFSYLDTFGNLVNAQYNSMTASLSQRGADTKFLGNLGFQLSYTYGKSIDNSSGFRTASNTNRVPAYDTERFRAISNFDLTQYLVFSGTWELPQKAWPNGPRRLVRGWTVYPILSYRTGLPLDIFAGLSRTRTSVGPSGAGDPNLVRVNLVTNNVTYFDPRNQVVVSTGRTGNYWFDPGAFERASLAALNILSNAGQGAVTNPALRTYGTLGRNALRGPDRFNADFTVSKITDLAGERVKLEIRGEFFNIFNRALWGDPNLSPTSPLFGQISTTGVTGDPMPRIIQLAARIFF